MTPFARSWPWITLMIISLCNPFSLVARNPITSDFLLPYSEETSNRSFPAKRTNPPTQRYPEFTTAFNIRLNPSATISGTLNFEDITTQVARNRQQAQARRNGIPDFRNALRALQDYALYQPGTDNLRPRDAQVTADYVTAPVGRVQIHVNPHRPNVGPPAPLYWAVVAQIAAIGLRDNQFTAPLGTSWQCEVRIALPRVYLRGTEQFWTPTAIVGTVQIGFNDPDGFGFQEPGWNNLGVRIAGTCFGGPRGC